ncbi:zinc cadmium resistance protein [Diplodia corticola]|uniref:Zinc cadmium resistance protein n=1 Tax=Diplodia corticola TaxID=236234 RepID=A0A1J9QLW2_9PEZI|nr:zinc cadmium resistance protein [Diplodia corticola]OJD29449.1 zinc cadmium resistance protein [Diplodia corticola]
MGLSKTTRISILLGIDSAFFFLELIVGYSVHSLALVADSFHMLNDVLSLCVGLWAVRAANATNHSRMFTYGFQRAETLGALINGVFLVALCLSIFLEAIQRFVEPQEVGNPRLVLIVGCFGLASNILGLFLFHDHGHSHGGHGHSHGHDELGSAEEGHSHADHAVDAIADERGNVVDVLPESRFGNWPSSQGMKRSSKDSGNFGENSSEGTARPSSGASRQVRRHSRSRSRSGYGGFGDLPVHPASFRNEIINAARMDSVESEESSDSDGNENGAAEGSAPTENSPLLQKSNVKSSIKRKSSHSHSHSHDLHGDHKHNQPKDSGNGGGHGHSHDLNMRGVFLHVMGDALGNIGVIASALIIWLTDFSWRFYSDPLISLIITVIILCSAIPLCKAASRILLQAAPTSINVEDIESDILDLPGIISCHHLHVWQLSDTKLVASLHVQVAHDFKGQGSARYMELARAIRRCLHAYGIHSSTIQPEFCLNEGHNHNASDHSDNSSCDGDPNSRSTTVSKKLSKKASKPGSLRSEAETCLLACGDACGDGTQCCPPKPTEETDGDDHHH